MSTFVTEDEFIDIASRMAQELQEFIDDAEQAGCKNPLPNTKELINEWENIYQRTAFYQQTRNLNDEEKPLPYMLTRQAN